MKIHHHKKEKDYEFSSETEIKSWAFIISRLDCHCVTYWFCSLLNKES